MRRHLALFLTLAAIIVVPGDLTGQDRPALSDYRAALMDGLRSHNGALRALAAGDVSESDHIVLHARAVADVAEMLQGVWPAGSGGEGTRALPAIWAEQGDFQSKLEELRGIASTLRDRAEAGDMDGVGSSLQELGSTCRGCHTDYRARAN